MHIQQKMNVFYNKTDNLHKSEAQEIKWTNEH